MEEAYSTWPAPWKSATGRFEKLARIPVAGSPFAPGDLAAPQRPVRRFRCTTAGTLQPTSGASTMKRSLARQLTKPPVLLATAVVAALLVAGCAVSSNTTIRPVPQVDLERFMGDWYVIGNIPTRPERNAFNAIESYTLQ